ncbi:MAG: sigma-70 family RNA polymerase sigma factor [Candidatus Omnitrophica bacterium]|nr:sigma-70 family RNA polymerase sigma factor [Candidatus Omnitrophota bacterium]
MTDEALLAACLEGKREAWRLFVERFAGLIHWSIRKTLEGTIFSRNSDLWDEIFQEVFTSLFEKNELARLKVVGSLKKYLTVAACRAALDKAKMLSRADKNTFPIDGLDLVMDSEGPEDRERERLLETALGELEPKDRACLEFCVVDGKTHREVGLILGIPRDTVSTIVRRTKEKLKTRLDGKGI